jgi:hypothetical protein
MVGEKRAGNICEFWIFQSVELTKETKRCALGRHCEIFGAHNNSWKIIAFHNNL